MNLAPREADGHPTPPKTIHVLAFDDNDELDVIAPYEVLYTIRKVLDTETPEVSIVSVPGTTKDPRAVCGIHGVTFGTRPLEPGEKPDLLIVAGGGYGVGPPPIGIMKVMHDKHFAGVIAEQYNGGRLLASVCTGAFGLAGAGVTRGRTMTTHPDAVDDFAKASGAHVLNPDTQARVVDDGKVISCGGVTSGTDLALYVVATFWPEIPSLSKSVRDWIDYHFYAQVARV
ncbi:MAG: DJ-1/PfpI family protein [Candidatus Eremiobacteraeota bacterium]|nr:DJ-1/PfpI family protein [Candidatus Eremiobacteraeota bacterium]